MELMASQCGLERHRGNFRERVSTMGYVERHSELLAKKGHRHAVLNGQLFVRRQKWVNPVGPACVEYKLTPAEAEGLARQLGGLWVAWTGGFDPEASPDRWYAVICRKFCPKDEMPAKRRYEVNKSLRSCEVKRVDADEIARHGYEVHVEALKGYGAEVSVPTREQFAAAVRRDSGFDDIRHHWAAYSGGEMIGFAHCSIYDRLEVDYSMIKLHPKHLPLYPGYGLIYRMNEYYLGECGVGCVNDGWRSVLHDTGMQEFLVQKFAFEKMPLALHVHFRRPLGAMLSLSTPIHPILSRWNRKLAAVFQLRSLRTA